MTTLTWTWADWIHSAHPPDRTSAQDDRVMIEGILSRNGEECFDRLVEKYKDRVFRLAVSILGPGCNTEAEDVTQEVFIQVYRKLSTFRQESEFSTWLYRITYNRALEGMRKARFRLPHQGEEALASMAAPGEGSNPVAVAMERQRRQIILEAIEELDEHYRTVIHLYYWLNNSVAEIAEQLGSRPGTIKSYLYRGREQLARILRREQEDD